MPDNRLLVVDDEPDIVALVADVAESCGYQVSMTADATKFEAMLAESKPSHIVLDLQMPGMDGIEMIRHLAAEGSRAKVILISGFDARVLESARRLGTARGLDIASALTKPLRVADLRALLESVRVAT